jgi:hypothetical protein
MREGESQPARAARVLLVEAKDALTKYLPLPMPLLRDVEVKAEELALEVGSWELTETFNPFRRKIERLRVRT